MKQLALLLPGSLAAEPESDRALAPAIIAGYQALWHPSLLHDAETLPQIRELANPPRGDDVVLAIPKACYDAADEIVRKDLTESKATIFLVEDAVGAHALLEFVSRKALTTQAPEVILDFFALGYARLGLGIFLRLHSSLESLDDSLFWEHVQQAASSFADGDGESTRSALDAALDVLCGLRQTTFPSTINWIDIALAPPEGAQPAFLDRLGVCVPWTLIATGDEVASWSPEIRDAVRTPLSDARFEVIGGMKTHRPLSLLPFESRVWEFSEAFKIYEEVLGREVDAFASTSAALHPEIPRLLMKFNFRYALHAAMDGSRFPALRGPKIHWTSADGSVVEALARTLTSAGDETGGLAIFPQLAVTVKQDRSPTMVLAHWIHASSAWYEFLLRVQQRAELFGKFETFSKYFLHASFPDGPTRTKSEEYDTGLFSEDRNPPPGLIDKLRERHRIRARFDAARSMCALRECLTAGPPDDLGALEGDMESGRNVEERIAPIERDALDRLAREVLRGAPKNSGYLVVNPCSFLRRVSLDLKGLAGPIAVERPVRAFEWGAERSNALVDVPGWGFAWIPNSPASDPPPSTLVPVAHGRRLKNTLIEVEIDRKSGGVRGAWLLRDGYSRLGQQIVHSRGSRMVCRRIEITGTGTIAGEITTSGDILDPTGKTILAEFSQSIRVVRGKQQFTIELEIAPRGEAAPEQSDGYFACRWAWPDDKTVLLPAGGFGMTPNHGPIVEAPDFIELREAGLTTDIVTSGLAFHRRVDYRMLDSILLSSGESRRTFRFVVALDAAHPWQLIQDSLWPCPVLPVEYGPPAVGASGWLAQLSGEGVVASSLAPLSGENPGIRVRLVETSGAAKRARLRFARQAASASLTNFRGERIYDVHAEDDGFPVDLSAHEMQQVEVQFSS